MNKNMKVILAIATLGVFSFSQVGLAVTKTVAKPYQPPSVSGTKAGPVETPRQTSSQAASQKQQTPAARPQQPSMPAVPPAKR